MKTIMQTQPSVPAAGERRARRDALVLGIARAAGAAVWHIARARVLVGAAALTISLAGTGCSKLTDLDGLSKAYGKPDAAPTTQDGSQDQHSDRAIPTSDARDLSLASDVRDGSTQDGGDVADRETGPRPGRGYRPRCRLDARRQARWADARCRHRNRRQSSADATAEREGPICGSEAINDTTLSSTPPIRP